MEEYEKHFCSKQSLWFLQLIYCMVEGIFTDLQVATVTGERRRDTARERPPNQSETKILLYFHQKRL
jgi:hypothetical protein